MDSSLSLTVGHISDGAVMVKVDIQSRQFKSLVSGNLLFQGPFAMFVGVTQAYLSGLWSIVFISSGFSTRWDWGRSFFAND